MNFSIAKRRMYRDPKNADLGLPKPPKSCPPKSWHGVSLPCLRPAGCGGPAAAPGCLRAELPTVGPLCAGGGRSWPWPGERERPRWFTVSTSGLVALVCWVRGRGWERNPRRRGAMAGGLGPSLGPRLGAGGHFSGRRRGRVPCAGGGPRLGPRLARAKPPAPRASTEPLVGLGRVRLRHCQSLALRACGACPASVRRWRSVGVLHLDSTCWRWPGRNKASPPPVWSGGAEEEGGQRGRGWPPKKKLCVAGGDGGGPGAAGGAVRRARAAGGPAAGAQGVGHAARGGPAATGVRTGPAVAARGPAAGGRPALGPVGTAGWLGPAHAGKLGGGGGGGAARGPARRAIQGGPSGRRRREGRPARGGRFGPGRAGGGHGGDEGGAREGPWAWDLHAGRWEARAMGPDPGLAPGRHAGRWEGRAGHPRPGASEARPTAPDLHASGFDRNGRRHEGRWQERASVAYDLPNRPLGGGQPQDGRRRCGAPNEVKMHAGGWEARARVAHEREHPKPSGASCAGLWEDRARYGKEAPAPPREFGRAGRWEARAEWVGARRGTPQQEAARAAARARGEADWETTQPILGNTPASNLPNSAGGRGREPPREAARRKAKEADAVRGPRQTLPEGGTGGWLGRIADHGTHRPPLRMGT